MRVATDLDPDFDRMAFRSADLTIGSFRARPGHPRFTDSGPPNHDLFVFPRTAVTIAHEGEKPFAAGPPIVTFYNRGQRYRRGRLSSDGDRCDWFALVPELLREVVAQTDPAAGERGRALFRFSHGPSDPRVYLRQRRLVESCLGAEPPDPLTAEETVLQLARAVVADAHEAWSGRATVRRASERPRHRRDLVESAKEILLLRFREPLGIVALSREVGTTPFHLCRIFRRATGWSLHQFRDQVRLRRALEEIPARPGELTALALELGYSSHSHFTAAFRRAFGVTPSAFARR
jgi:AraC-like DNA-binding protein